MAFQVAADKLRHYSRPKSAGFLEATCLVESGIFANEFEWHVRDMQPVAPAMGGGHGVGQVIFNS